MVTVTNTGLVALSKLANGVDSLDPFTYMGLGSSSTLEAATQTTLISEIVANGGERASATCTYVADYTAKWVVTFTFTGNVTINECAIFNAASVGVMLIRHVFANTKSLVNGDKLELTITMETSEV